MTAEVKVTCRPLMQWPGKLRSTEQRKYPQFSSTWTSTMDLLVREARMLGARELVIQLAVVDSDIRIDGQPRATAKPSHPGVTVVLPDSNVGRISWSTDIYRGRNVYRQGSYREIPGWQANVRAIALSMEALRAADRHDVMQGRQYAGFRELGSGIAMAPPRKMTVEEAAGFLVDHGEYGGERGDPEALIDDPSIASAYFRSAAKRLHPDAGGDPDLFRTLQEAKKLLDGVSV